MTAFHPEALKAAQAAYRDHALAKEFTPGAVEKIVAAYLSVAFPESASPEESARFVSPDGVPMVSVVVGKSVPFARALVYEWSLLDRVERSHMLRWKAISLPAATYDAILDRVRLRLRPGGGE